MSGDYGSGMLSDLTDENTTNLVVNYTAAAQTSGKLYSCEMHWPRLSYNVYSCGTSTSQFWPTSDNSPQTIIKLCPRGDKPAPDHVN